MSNDLSVEARSIKLGDGFGMFIQAGMVDVIQDDGTLPDLGMSCEQRVMLEFGELMGLREAARDGKDWSDGGTQAFYMGDGIIVVEQEDHEAPWRGSPTIYQRVALNDEDLDALVCLAA